MTVTTETVTVVTLNSSCCTQAGMGPGAGPHSATAGGNVFERSGRQAALGGGATPGVHRPPGPCCQAARTVTAGEAGAPSGTVKGLQPVLPGPGAAGDASGSPRLTGSLITVTVTVYPF